MANAPKIPNPSFLAGEVHALLTFAQVLAETHPQRESLRSEFQAASQAGLAKVENQPAADALVLGYQFAIAQIAQALGIPTVPPETHSTRGSD